MLGRFLAGSLMLKSCITVLDLSAERGSGSGGSSSTGTGGGATSSHGDSASSGRGSTSAQGTGGAACPEPVAHFAGGQFIVIDNPTHNALDADDKIAVAAWIRPDALMPGTMGYEGYVVSRLSDGAKKG